ncbi:LacI family DNA-binding transcriptional regulator [Vallitalea pronyensis]|uniref:LacI family DNA-binding transcriptional regulator n=1 Tax=Vallitalea pronyensis TaxID=1348613 RepID=A0A8J8MHZ0_9FIRM|nr:LacI family DNA-binding transcriptional regulator [Vallitalea pronyensis]QUI22172.1 LacI family DNA-binding transcriptional regulator [Vallitalea pronyensis]
MVGLKDIAKACGISMTQVSRALNGKDDVSDKTKKLVLETAKRMGYVKNIAAQRLATQQSNQIALFHKGINDNNKFSGTMLVNFLKGMNECLTNRDWEPVLHLVDNFEIPYADYCKQRNIPGVIVMGMAFDDERYLELIKSDFPVVVNDIPIEGENKGCVIINNAYYAAKAVELLITKGCQHIGMLCGHDHASVTIERKAGYQMAIVQQGITYNPDYVVNAMFNYQTAYDKTLALIANHSEIDGIFCHSDAMAIACMKAIQHAGKSIPEDIKVIGFDDIVISEFANPPLSTVKQDYYKKGYVAAQLILDIIQHNEVPYTQVVPCEIIDREST